MTNVASGQAHKRRIQPPSWTPWLMLLGVIALSVFILQFSSRLGDASAFILFGLLVAAIVFITIGVIRGVIGIFALRLSFSIRLGILALAFALVAALFGVLLLRSSAPQSSRIESTLSDQSVDADLPHTPYVSSQTPPSNSSIAVDAPFAIVRVHYGTNRAIMTRSGSPIYPPRFGTLTFGTATVSIPRDHRVGYWEEPLVASFESQEKHVVLLSVSKLSTTDFVNGVKARVERSSRNEAFVFVHGYNTGFTDAITRTALLAYDLKFDGAPIAFVWPSRAHYAAYPADEEAAATSVDDLETFLAIVARSGATRIHLIAHSMGNRILLQALRNLQRRQALPQNVANLILAAPDVNVTLFQRLTSAAAMSAARVTLYASSSDSALVASHHFHDMTRAGEGGANLLLADGVDTIDVSAVDTSFVGHSYYGDNRSVITDLHELISDDSPPNRRICLSPKTRVARHYWVFDRCK